MDHEYLTVNQRRIAYVHSPATATPENTPSVLFCGGFKSDMQGLKAMAFEAFCKQRNISYTRFDYNGHGSSDGKFEEGDIGSWAEDALAVFDNVASNHSQGVVVIGSSMGAWIATLIARQRSESIAGIMTLAAAPDFTEKLLLPSLTDSQRSTLQSGETLNLPSRYDDGSPYPISANLIDKSRDHLVLNSPVNLNIPIRLIHGTGDPDVPHSMSTMLMETFQSDDIILTLIKDADHRLSNDAELKILIQTLQSLLE